MNISRRTIPLGVLGIYPQEHQSIKQDLTLQCTEPFFANETINRLHRAFAVILNALRGKSGF
jgi:hypothetical protein